MKVKFLISLFLVSSLFNLVYSQKRNSKQNDFNCKNNDKFNLIQIPQGDERGVYIKFDEDSYGRKHPFFKDYKPIEYSCSLKEITGEGPKELIIRWTNKAYGTGGGREQKGIQIWSLKSRKRLFKAKTLCREESFGRQDAEGYVVKCQRAVKIRKKEISIGGIKCEKEGEWEESNASCFMDSIESGHYKVGSNGLVKSFATSYIQDNETTLLAFGTKNDKRLVIAKDTADKYLLYRFGTLEKIELEYPSSRKNSWRQFKFSYYFRGGGIQNEGVDFNYLYFKKGNYRYVVYQEYTARSKETKYGIKVINLKTKETTKIKAKPSTVEGSLGEFRDNDKIKEGDKLFD